MNFISRKFTSFLTFLLITSLLLTSFSPALAENSLMWNKSFPSHIRWEQMTSLGVILAGTKDDLMAIDGKTGDTLWVKTELEIDIEKNQVWPIDGTDIVLVSDQNKQLGGIISTASLYALEIMTGDVIWSAYNITGRPLDVVPMLDKNAFLYITDQQHLEEETLSEEPILPYIYAMDIHTGKINWEREYDKPVEGMKLKDNWLGYKTYDLSGYYRPLNLEEEIYFFYSGITKMNLETGETIWQTTYPIGDMKILKTDADPIFTDKVIYATGKGYVKAIDRETGKILWDSGTLGIVPMLLMEDNIICAQRGGFFYNPSSGNWVSQGPFGAAAINIDTGEVLWNYNKAEKSITNILIQGDKVIFADKNNLIALDKYTGEKIYMNALGENDSPMFVFSNSEGNIILKFPQIVSAFDSQTGVRLWKTEVREPASTLGSPPFMLTAGLFLGIATGGAAALLFSSYVLIKEYVIQTQGAVEARLKAKFKAEQTYWQNVKEYRDTPGLREAETKRNYRLTIIETKKDNDPHIYLEGQLKDRKDFTGVIGVNTKTGNVDQGVYLGKTGEIYLLDYVEEMLFHIDGKNVSGYSVIPR